MATVVEQLLEAEGVKLSPASRINADCPDTYLEELSKSQLSCSPEKLAEVLGVGAQGAGLSNQEKIHEVLKHWKSSNEDGCSYRHLIEALSKCSETDARTACRTINKSKRVGPDGVVPKIFGAVPPDEPFIISDSSDSD